MSKGAAWFQDSPGGAATREGRGKGELLMGPFSPHQAWATRSSSSHSTSASSTTSSSPGRCTTSSPPSLRSCPGPTATTPGTAPAAPTPAPPPPALTPMTPSGPPLPPSTLSKWGPRDLVTPPGVGRGKPGQPPAPAASRGCGEDPSLACAASRSSGLLWAYFWPHL